MSLKDIYKYTSHVQKETDGTWLESKETIKRRESVQYPFHSYTSAGCDPGPAALGANWQDSAIVTAHRGSSCRTFDGPGGFWNGLFYFDAGHYYVHRNDWVTANGQGWLMLTRNLDVIILKKNG